MEIVIRDDNNPLMLLPLKKRICLEFQAKEKNTPIENLPSILLPLKKRICLELQPKEKNTPIISQKIPTKSIINYNLFCGISQDKENKPPESIIINSTNGNDYKNNPKKKTLLRCSRVDDETLKQRKRQKILHPSFEYSATDLQNSVADEYFSDVITVIEKKLQKSDVGNGQARLSIPNGQVMCRFLSKEEEEYIKRVDKSGKKYKIAVKVRVSNSDADHELFLTRWNYKDNPGFRYALNGSWGMLRKASGLQEGDVIRVNAFRSKDDGGLCFAIHKVRGNKRLPLPTWGCKAHRTKRLPIMDNEPDSLLFKS